MNFPLPHKRIGDCIAIIGTDGLPLFVRYRDVYGVDGLRGHDNRWKAHRLPFHLNCHSIPRRPVSLKHELVLHNCDNKWCINPAHLRLGSASDNHKDAASRIPNYSEIKRCARLGKPCSDELKARLRQANIGKVISDATRANMSIAAKRRHERERLEQGK